MNKKLIVLFFVGILISLSNFAQKTEIIKEPKRILNNANELFNEKKYALAYQLYLDYINISNNVDSKELEDAYYFKAICGANLSNNDADILFSDFIRLYPNSSKVNNAYFYLANYYQGQNNFQQAIKTFKQIDEKGLTKDQQQEYNYKLGYCLFNIQDFDSAKDYFSKVKDARSKYSSPATYYYGHILYNEKKYDAALREFNSMKNDKNFKGIVPYYIVQIYYLQGNYKELIKNSKELSENSNSKRSSETNRMLGEAYCKLERYEEAIPYLEKGVKDNPAASAEDNYLLGFTLCRNEKYLDAIPFLSKAIDNKDSLAQNAYYNLGYCYLKTSDKQAARTAFKEAYDLDYDAQIKEDALLNYAKLSYELPNPFNETLKSFQTYYTNYPKSKKINEVKEYLAQLYGASKNYQDALRLIEELPNRSITINQAYQRISLNRGIEVLNEGRYSEAIKLFTKSIENDYDSKLTSAAYYLKAESMFRGMNFDGSVKTLNQFFKLPNASKSIYFAKANYTMGYNYFKKKTYKPALEYFNRFVKAADGEDEKVIADSYNRIGDCHFMFKDFNSAIDQYNQVIKLNVIDVDYAMYQKAVSTGALGNTESKSSILQKALTSYPNSSYRSSILFDLANCYLILDQSEKALQTYKMVITEYPQSNHTKACIGKMGLIYYKQGKDELALETLNTLVKTYPTSEESKDGLKSIRQIYVDQNKVDDYYEYVKTIPNVNYSLAEKDSITYEAVENVYMDGDCQKSIVGFRDYLNKFPNGFFAINAHYYLADCLTKNSEMDSALSSYLFIAKSPKSKFSEKSILNAANITFNKKDYPQSKELFLRLEKESEVSTHASLSQLGIMRANFYLNSFDSAIVYAKKVLTNTKNTTIINDEATYIIAKSLMNTGDTKLSLEEFKKLKKSKNGEYSGEANFIFAENSFNNKKLDESEKMILAISANPTSEYWLAKSIILLGDIYVQKNKTLMAKQTYQSIVDNYEGEELVNIAKSKVDELVKKEEEAKALKEVKVIESKKEVDEIIIDSKDKPSATTPTIESSVK